MYDVDERDIVTPLEGVPRCDPGAPVPMVVAAEGTAVVAYYGSLAVDWATARPRDVPKEEVVLLQFSGVRDLMFGAPNDEALDGHPLAAWAGPDRQLAVRQPANLRVAPGLAACLRHAGPTHRRRDRPRRRPPTYRRDVFADYEGTTAETFIVAGPVVSGRALYWSRSPSQTRPPDLPRAPLAARARRSGLARRDEHGSDPAWAHCR